MEVCNAQYYWGSIPFASTCKGYGIVGSYIPPTNPTKPPSITLNAPTVVTDLKSVTTFRGQQTFTWANQPTQVQGNSGRPDADGYLTLSEANNWYRNGGGQPLEVDINKINLSAVYAEDFNGVGSIKSFNLLIHSGSLNDGLVYGTITLRLYPNSMVRAYQDKYNFEMHTWLNPFEWGRNFETIIGGWYARGGAAYKININGSKWINPVHPTIK